MANIWRDDPEHCREIFLPSSGPPVMRRAFVECVIRMFSGSKNPGPFHNAWLQLLNDSLKTDLR